jgi:hypothetical protein
MQVTKIRRMTDGFPDAVCPTIANHRLPIAFESGVVLYSGEIV